MAKEVNIKVKAQTDDASKKFKSLGNEMKSWGKGSGSPASSIGNMTGKLGKLAKVAGPIGIAVTAATKAFKQAVKVIKETTEAYREQAKAEKQLETAAKNNPLLDDSSVRQLKKYASQLQSVSTVGDEKLLPLMGQLAAAGRSQAEIQDIMSAALDISASGAMSLDSAVRNLNKTFGGYAGELGETNPKVKALTKEQLKQGDAVKVLAEQYKGMAKEVADATGTNEQLKNAYGDLLEAVGASFEKKLAPLRKELTNLINWAAEGVKTATGQNEMEPIAEVELKIASYEELRKNNNVAINDLIKEGLSYSSYEVKMLLESNKFYTQQIGVLKTKLEVEEKLKKEQEEKNKKEQQEAERLAKQNKANETASKRRQEGEEKTRKGLLKYENELFIKGQEVNKNSVEYQQLKLKLIEEEMAYLLEIDEISINNPRIQALKEEQKLLQENIAIANQGTEEEIKFSQELQNVAGEISKHLEKAKTVVDGFAEVMNGVVSLMTENMEAENEQEMASLDKQYTDGLISYEEYCKKKDELTKKQAQEEYKIRMWEWSISLTQAIANVAMGIATALTGAPPMSYINAALTGAAGAVQIATITANKPKPPAFATGGIVGGNSYTGDKVTAHVNSGEMILNKKQQAQLFSIANGSKGNASISMPVTINNNASNKVSAESQMSQQGLIITVNEIVNSQMQKGAYTNSMRVAESRASGARYL